jgi:ribosomal protein S27AE
MCVVPSRPALQRTRRERSGQGLRYLGYITCTGGKQKRRKGGVVLMGERSCPNCGQAMLAEMSQRQRAGGREVVLQWGRCPACKHVLLLDWRFVDAEVETEEVKW